MKITIIHWLLEYTLKVAGLWPNYFNILGPVVMTLVVFGILPFQLWDAVNLLDKPTVLMDSLSNVIPEIIIYTKLFILWSNRRFDKYLVL